MDENPVTLLLFGFIGVVLMFAQLKLFSIDSSLRKILELLEREARQRPSGGS